MDNETIRVAVGLHLGVALCNPHLCQHCGAAVELFGLHGLSCRFSTGRHYSHAALNDIIHRALSTSHIPSKLEPTGLDRSLMGNVLMASWWFHGKAITFWFGMPHVLTPVPPLTWHSPLWQQVMLLVRQMTWKSLSTLLFGKTSRHVFHPYCHRNIRSTWSSFHGLSQRARSQAFSHNWWHQKLQLLDTRTGAFQWWYKGKTQPPS